MCLFICIYKKWTMAQWKPQTKLWGMGPRGHVKRQNETQWKGRTMISGNLFLKMASVRNWRQKLREMLGCLYGEWLGYILKIHPTVLRLFHANNVTCQLFSPGLGPSKISFITIHGSSNKGITVGLYTVSPVKEGYKFYPGDEQHSNFITWLLFICEDRPLQENNGSQTRPNKGIRSLSFTEVE